MCSRSKCVTDTPCNKDNFISNFRGIKYDLNSFLCSTSLLSCPNVDHFLLSISTRVIVLLQLHTKLLEAERQVGELQGRLKEQRQLSGEKLKDREQQAADLQLKLSRSEEQVEG